MRAARLLVLFVCGAAGCSLLYGGSDLHGTRQDPTPGTMDVGDGGPPDGGSPITGDGGTPLGGNDGGASDMGLPVLHTIAFGTPQLLNSATDGTNYGLQVGDFNGDHHMDIALADSYNDALVLLLGRGDGTFASFVSVPITGCTDAYDLVAGDFDKNGKLDAAVACHDNNKIAVLMNGGNDTNGHPIWTTTLYPLPEAPDAIAAGDFDNDGWLDLAVADDTSPVMADSNGYVSVVYQSSTTHAFGTAYNYSTGVGTDPGLITAGDFNHDGRTDLLAGLDDKFVVLSSVSGSRTTEFNAAADSYTVQDSSSFHQLVVADVLGNGAAPDLLGGNNDGLSFYPDKDVANADPAVSAFGPRQAQAGDYTNVLALAVADFNRDGHPDVMASSWDETSQAKLDLFLGDGQGGLLAKQGFGPLANTTGNLVAIADFKEDGLPDVVTCDFNTNVVTVLLNQSH